MNAAYRTERHMPPMSEEESAFWQASFWQAIERRDSALDGVFYYAVITTGVFCRPSCASRLPRPENVLFFRERADAEQAGFRACLRCRPTQSKSNPQAEMIRRVCRHIEANLDGDLRLEALGRELGLSPFHLQRTFKSVLGIAPRAYADACRIESLKQSLRAGHSVTRAMVDAGYSSTSRLYERTSPQLGMSPKAYQSGGKGVAIRYGIADSPVGLLLIAASDKGICAIRMADRREELEETLRSEFPKAELTEDPALAAGWTERLLSGTQSPTEIPLDIRSTAFQRQVWEYLQKIPRGETRSYGQVAKDLGRPTAQRAVARACASNPVALLIPCHRVVRGDGGLGGYRWGVDRKRAILERERR